jgi:hypothetical protein
MHESSRWELHAIRNQAVLVLLPPVDTISYKTATPKTLLGGVPVQTKLNQHIHHARARRESCEDDASLSEDASLYVRRWRPFKRDCGCSC